MKPTPPFSLVATGLIATLCLLATGGSAQDGFSKEDRAAMDVGRKILAVRAAIANPKAPGSLQTVRDLGGLQASYTMTRGWLALELQGAQSIYDARKDKTPQAIVDRIAFLKKAIRAIDLE